MLPRLIVLSVLGLFGLLIAACSTVSMSSIDQSSTDLPTPSLRLATADGVFDLSEQSGNVVVLYFSFTG